MSRVPWVVSAYSVLQHLYSPFVAVLRTHPLDCRDVEGNALRACRIRSGEAENATGLPGVYRRRASFMRTSETR